jgi:ankyrin repeat protein
VTAFWIANICSAQIYRYTNEKGVPCFTDDIDKVPEEQRPDVKSTPKSSQPAHKSGKAGRKTGSKPPQKARIDHLSKQLLSRAGIGDVDTVRRLLERGADVHIRDRHGETALMKAARHGNYPVANLLIEHGADIHAKDATGSTALSYAKSFGQKEMVELLKRHGAME